MSRISASGAVLAEGHDQLRDPALQQVVAEVHHERARPQEGLGRQHGVRETERLVLEDVGDADPEARAVSGRLFDLAAGLRGDHDPDLLDPGLGHRLDAVEQHRLVGHGNELLGARVGDRAQPRALAPRQDQSLQRLHCRGSTTGARCAGAGAGPGRARAGAHQ